MKKQIMTKNAPSAIGPYSQAIVKGDRVYVSGQLGIDKNTNEFVEGGIKEQTACVLSNIKEILKEAKMSMDDVLKVRVYLKNMDDFKEMNEVYATFFNPPYPARAAIEVSRLPKDGLVEMEAEASK